MIPKSYFRSHMLYGWHCWLVHTENVSTVGWIVMKFGHNSGGPLTLNLASPPGHFLFCPIFLMTGLVHMETQLLDTFVQNVLQIFVIPRQ